MTEDRYERGGETLRSIDMHMAVYGGFPAPLNGMFAAKEVFEARKQDGES